MEQFLEQSAQAEENFYRLEEQRLQAEDRRRETEHARELHMLQMLGQMFSSMSSSRAVSSTVGSAASPSKPPPPVRPPVISSASHSHVRRPSAQTDCFSQQSQSLSAETQALGICSGVVCVNPRGGIPQKNIGSASTLLFIFFELYF